MNDKSTKSIVAGVGSALVDILIHENDSFLRAAGIERGGMTLVDHETIAENLAISSESVTMVPGGSACNTVIGISKLGGKSRFIGKLGEDDFGDMFKRDLVRSRVEPVLFPSPYPTGRVLSVITPDAQRSMMTFLGAAANADPNDITEACFKDAAIVHVEGYLVFNEQLISHTLKTAKQTGALVSLDLSSYTVVEAYRDLLTRLTDQYVDILLANEDEARAFTGTSDENEAIHILGRHADIAVLKLGPKGSLILHQNQLTTISPVGGKDIADTTGAGDLWASGFLFGFVNDYPLEICGKIGSVCGYEVCRIVGADIPEDGWDKINQTVQQLIR